MLEVGRIVFTGPLSITKSQITVTEKDVVCDLPYPLQCGLWLITMKETPMHWGNGGSISDPGRFELKPSCSRVVYEYFSERAGLPPFFLKAVEEADIIDSFAYASIEEWRKETPGKAIDWTLKTNFKPHEDSFAYLRNMVQQLRDRPLDEVFHLPFVQKRLKQYREEEVRMMKP